MSKHKNSSLEIVALVPMRHTSHRVKGKNYRNFAGKPLYHHIVKTLGTCPLISKVVIDTDSEFIMEDVQTNFPNTTLIPRPENLRSDDTPMNDVLLHDVTEVKADLYLQTHSTNPLLLPKTITHAIEFMIQNYPIYDSLFAVTKLETRIWDVLARPINHNPSILLRTQDLPPIYEENSNIYIFSGENLTKRHNRIGERPYLFEIDRLEAWDIDEELDFTIAEFLYSNRNLTIDSDPSKGDIA